MKKQIERTEKTKASILDAFWELYAKKPITKITVNELTKQADIHRSTFYLYFTDIYDVLTCAKELLMADCAGLFDSIRTPDDAINIANIFGHFYKNNISKLSAIMGPAGDPAFSYELRDRILPQLMDAFSVPENDKEMRIALEYMITAAFALLIYARDSSSDEELAECIGRIHSFLSYGISPMLKAHSTDPGLLNRMEESRVRMLRGEFTSKTAPESFRSADY